MLMKGARFFTIFCLLVIAPIGLWAQSADFYSAWSNLLKNFADPNTGLTSFPTLLIPMGGRLEGMGTAYTAMAGRRRRLYGVEPGGQLPHGKD